MFDVSVGGLVFEHAATQFGPDRSPEGSPSEHDFVAGPLADAVVAFQAFDQRVEAAGPSVRSVVLIDAVFGPVSFVAVLTAPGCVEIFDFVVDADYWRIVDGDPDP